MPFALPRISAKTVKKQQYNYIRKAEETHVLCASSAFFYCFPNIGNCSEKHASILRLCRFFFHFPWMVSSICTKNPAKSKAAKQKSQGMKHFLGTFHELLQMLRNLLKSRFRNDTIFTERPDCRRGRKYFRYTARKDSYEKVSQFSPDGAHRALSGACHEFLRRAGNPARSR